MDPVRFWSRVNVGPRTACWLWRGRLRVDGYARIKVKEKGVYAHRYAYTLLRGSIPAGAQLDHRCRNRGCQNPWHLEPVTQKVNILRGAGACARHARKSRCPRGHTYDMIKKNGSRWCRTCANAYSRAYLSVYRTGDQEKAKQAGLAATEATR